MIPHQGCTNPSGGCFTASACLFDCRKTSERYPMSKLSGSELDTLIALVESGPLWDGDLPSKTGRDSLIARGLAVCVVVRGEDGWQAATYAGRDAYKTHFPGPDGELADTISEARINRIARRAIRSAGAKR